MTALKDARPGVRHLVRDLRFRSSFGRPCYVKYTEGLAALIVPHLSSGADGPYSYLRMVHRTTVREAINLGFITIGAERVDVPAFDSNTSHWSAHPYHQGRTISATEVAR